MSLLTPTIDLSQIVGISGNVIGASPGSGPSPNPATTGAGGGLGGSTIGSSSGSIVGPGGTAGLTGAPGATSSPTTGTTIPPTLPNVGGVGGPVTIGAPIPPGAPCQGLAALAPSCWLQGLEVYGFLLLLVALGLYGLLAPQANVLLQRAGKAAGAAGALA